MTLKEVINRDQDQYMSLRKAYAVAKMAHPNTKFEDVQKAVRKGDIFSKKLSWPSLHYRFSIRPIDIISYLNQK